MMRLAVLLLLCSPVLAERLPDFDPATARWIMAKYRALAPSRINNHDYSVRFVAQGLAESKLDETAESPVGARGMYQVMPRTARGFGFDPAELWDWKINVFAGLKVLFANYHTGRSSRRDLNPPAPLDDLEVAMIAFNCGGGHVYYRKNGDGKFMAGGLLVARGLPLTTDNVLLVLPEVIGHHALEPTSYIKRIRNYSSQLLKGGW